MLNFESMLLAWCRGSGEDAVKLIELMCSDSSKGIRRSHPLKIFLVEKCGNHLILQSWKYRDDLPYHVLIRDLLDIERALISSTSTFKREYMSLTLSLRFMTKVLNFLVKPSKRSLRTLLEPS